MTDPKVREGAKFLVELAPDDRIRRIEHGFLIVNPNRPARILWDDGRESFPKPAGGIGGNINHGEAK